MDDAEAIARFCPAVGTVSPEIRDMRRVAYGARGDEDDLGRRVPARSSWPRTTGRSIGDGPSRPTRSAMRPPICLLGASIADQLFPNGGELERFVQIGSESYGVVGVLSTKGKMFGQDQDQLVVVPIGRLAR